MGMPELFIVHLLQPVAVIGVANGHVPVRTDVALEQQAGFRRRPGRNVDTVGHVGDRHFIFRNAGPEMMPHPAGDGPVELTDAIAVGRHAFAEDKHGKRRFGGAALGLAPTDDGLEAGAQFFFKRFQTGGHHVHREIVVPGRHGCVRGKNRGPRQNFHRGL